MTGYQGRRGTLLELVAVVMLVLAFGFVLITLARTQLRSADPLVTVTLASDPEGATVSVGSVVLGTTPVTFEIPREVEFRYTVRAREPFSDYDLYKPFEGVLTPRGDTNLAVWIPRTSLEEQEAQRLGRHQGGDR